MSEQKESLDEEARVLDFANVLEDFLNEQYRKASPSNTIGPHIGGVIENGFKITFEVIRMKNTQLWNFVVYLEGEKRASFSTNTLEDSSRYTIISPQKEMIDLLKETIPFIVQKMWI